MQSSKSSEIHINVDGGQGLQKKPMTSASNSTSSLQRPGNTSQNSLTRMAQNVKSILKNNPITTSRDSLQDEPPKLSVASHREASVQKDKSDVSKDGIKKTTFQLADDSEYDNLGGDNFPKQQYGKKPSSPTATNNQPPTLASVIASNRALLQPYYLTFKQHDLENEFSKYFVKFNFARWGQGTTAMFSVLTAIYIYFIVQNFMDAQSLKLDPITCPKGAFCTYCALDMICTTYNVGYDVGFWLVAVCIPFLASKFCASHFQTTVFSDYSDAISTCLIVFQVFVGIGVRFFVVHGFQEFLQPTLIMNAMLVFSFYGLRVRFMYAVAAVVTVCACWLVLNIVPLILSSSGITSIIFYTHRSFIIGSVFAILTAGVTSFTSYETEYFYRMQFLMSKEMKKNNAKLTNQLRLLAKTYNKKAGSLDSPLERSVMIIRSVMADPVLSSQHLMALGQVLALLNSSNLLTPDLEGTLGESLDNEQQAWLFSEIAARRRGVGRVKTKSRRRASVAQDASIRMDTVTESVTEAEARSRVIVGDKENLEDIGAAYPPVLESINQLLLKSNDYNWHIFEFTQATSNHSLSVLSHHLFTSANLFEAFSIPRDKFRNFLTAIEKGYHADLPYHNSIHATDVLHCMAYLANLETVNKITSDIEIFSMYLAAIIHDHDHPGVTNNFLVSTLDSKAMLYNDKAVLESHHLASSFQVLSQPQNNFLSHLSKAEFKAIREIVIDLVLATDLTQHLTLLSMFKAKMASIETYDPYENREDRMLLYKIMIKCSDVSNPSKEMFLYDPWVRLIMEEFVRQGDMEKKLGIPVSPYMDRDNMNVASCQIGFIDYVVMPLFDAFDKYLAIPSITKTLQRNREYWSNLKAQGVTHFGNSGSQVVIPIPGSS
ncbi:hypothetical protein EDD86DRAFT_201692 [Gorgonomyces haynaldii]|nr:hypothetical protein EDD86DRAFT_201692 [Gorgonomyces haynaldii]